MLGFVAYYIRDLTVNELFYFIFTVAVIFDAAGTLRTLSGGGLDGTYKALQFHVHFGDSDGDGSEHTFNGMQTPMEVGCLI